MVAQVPYVVCQSTAMKMVGHERIHQCDRPGSCNSHSIAVEASDIILIAAEHDLVSRRKTEVIQFSHLFSANLLLPLHNGHQKKKNLAQEKEKSIRKRKKLFFLAADGKTVRATRFRTTSNPIICIDCKSECILIIRSYCPITSRIKAVLIKILRIIISLTRHRIPDRTRAKNI